MNCGRSSSALLAFANNQENIEAEELVGDKRTSIR